MGTTLLLQALVAWKPHLSPCVSDKHARDMEIGLDGLTAVCVCTFQTFSQRQTHETQVLRTRNKGAPACPFQTFYLSPTIKFLGVLIGTSGVLFKDVRPLVPAVTPLAHSNASPQCYL